MVALITTESVEELGLEVGQQVTALIKATDVMILVDEGLECTERTGFRGNRLQEYSRPDACCLKPLLTSCSLLPKNPL